MTIRETTRRTGRVLASLAKPGGRTRRQHWLCGYITLTMISAASSMLLHAAFDFKSYSATPHIVGLIVISPIAVLSLRRLHDADHSGWWLLLLTPLLLGWAWHEVRLAQWREGMLADHVLHDMPTEPLWMFLARLIAMVVFLAFLASPGTKGPNRFGPDPR